MRAVAILCTKLNEGGAERFAVNLANSLSKYDFTIYLITGPKGEKEYTLDKSVNRIPLISNNKNLLFDAKKIRRFCIEKNISTLIAINLYPNFIACLANQRLKAKVVITERNAPGYLKLSWKTRLLKRLLYGRADQYVFQTTGAKDCYSANIVEKSVVIQNPVKPNLPVKDSDDRTEIVAVGRLEEQKNYDCLIKAFSTVCGAHPEYKLIIYGQGTLRNKLGMLCDELGVADKVVFQGFCFDVHEKIERSQIYVMSSDFEGMPNSLMEAMAMGFPVISTDCPTGGPKALIQDGKNGFLVNVGDYVQMADRIMKLIDDPGMRKHMGEMAKKIRISNSEEKIISEWIEKVLN